MNPSFFDRALQKLQAGGAAGHAADAGGATERAAGAAGTHGAAGRTVTATRISGGDISEAYALEAGGHRLFCKVQEATRGKAMFEAEVRGLEALRVHFPRVPTVVGTGVQEGKAFLVLDWLEEGTPRPDRWARLGEGLARLHQGPVNRFGLEENNFIATLPQDNHPEPSWATFYIRRRLTPLWRQGVEQGLFTVKTLGQVAALEERLEMIFPKKLPALVHGDLWSGNTRVGPDGDLWIFDPAVYRGHREMDLAMTRLFGGFPPVFYEAYAHYYPLEPGWEERVEICQLYPLLVHALLFGGGYVRDCVDIVATYAGG